jgi:DNA-binding NtrC family response regulator
LASQAKLLRVVEEGVVRRVGGLTARPAAPRWIVTCQECNPQSNVGQGLRRDLWYRLSAIVIRIPPLRDRRSDIPALVAHFLRMQHFDPERFERSALDLLAAAPWHGNVRELKQVTVRLALGANGSHVTAVAVRRELQAPGDPSHTSGRSEMLRVLEAHEWNLQRAARALGVARGTLYRRLRAVGLERPPRRPLELTQSSRTS